MADDPLQKLSYEEKERLAELVKGNTSRRDLLKAGGALGVGALLGGGGYAASTQTAKADPSTSDSDGNVGTPSNPVDVFAEGIGGPTGDVVDVGDSLVPDTDASYDLGSSTNSWNNGHFGSVETDQATVGNAEVESLNNLGYVDASTATDTDLNDALSNNADGAVLTGGTLILDSTSIVIPTGKTLYLKGNAGLKVDSAVSQGDGTLNTVSTNTNRIFEPVVDMTSVDDAALISVGGRSVIDANVGGSVDRMHVIGSNGVEHRLEGALETRGGRGIWAFDITDYVAFDIIHDHQNDPNSQGSAVINAEGLEEFSITRIHAFGDSAQSNYVTEAVDINDVSRKGHISDIKTDDIFTNAVDLTNATRINVESVTAFESNGEGAVTVTADPNSSPIVSSKSPSNFSGDQVSVRGVDLEMPSADTVPAVQAIVKNDGSMKHLTAKDCNGINTRAFDVTFVSMTNTNALEGMAVEATARNASGQGIQIDPTELSNGANIDVVSINCAVYIANFNTSTVNATVYNPSSDGVTLKNCNHGTYSVTSFSASGDGLVVDDCRELQFDVSLNNNGGYGIRAKNNGYPHHYSGTAESNTSGQTTGLNANSVVNLV